MRYAVVDTRQGYPAFVPDLASCSAVGATVRGVTRSIRSQVDGFRADGVADPLPDARVAHVAPDGGGSGGSLSGDGPEDDVYRDL